MNTRHKTYKVKVGSVYIGGNEPIVVQSMTDTDTADAIATANQIYQLAEAGSELVRITVNNEQSAIAIPKIVNLLAQKNCNVPIVGDFHYNGHDLLNKYPEAAELLAKYRINPGNVGFGNKKDDRFNMIIDTALKFDKPIRIGVNWGSLDQSILTKLMDDNSKHSIPKSSQEVLHEALVQSALTSAETAVSRGMKKEKIIISCKVSRVLDLISVYNLLASKCNYALHLGLTEAGMGSKGITSSSAALSVLLYQGIGDTIRTSLTPEPNQPRENEVIVSQQILQALDVRSFSPEVTSCPGCGRTTSSFFRVLTDEIDKFLRSKMRKWRNELIGVEQLKVAVMGCIVNGPGESKYANIGISLPGTGENPSAPVFIDGVKTHTLRGENITNQYKKIIEQYVYKKYTCKQEIIATKSS
jgi:(E)-4-hydroxy-3-methylbut-2-enyl-diphosphate synthase